MNFIELPDTNITVNPLAVAYIDDRIEDGGESDGGCILHLVNGQKLIITGDDANAIIYENDTENHNTPIVDAVNNLKEIQEELSANLCGRMDDLIRSISKS